MENARIYRSPQLARIADRAGFTIPAARRVLVCQFELPTPHFVADWR